MSCEWAVFVESVTWFNRGPARFQRPDGDSSDSGKDRDPNDPSDDGWLLFYCCVVRNDFTMITSICCGATSRALDLRSAGREFKSYSGQSCITTLGKLFTFMCLCRQVV